MFPPSLWGFVVILDRLIDWLIDWLIWSTVGKIAHGDDFRIGPKSDRTPRDSTVLHATKCWKQHPHFRTRFWTGHCVHSKIMNVGSQMSNSEFGIRILRLRNKKWTEWKNKPACPVRETFSKNYAPIWAARLADRFTAVSAVMLAHADGLGVEHHPEIPEERLITLLTRVRLDPNWCLKTLKKPLKPLKPLVRRMTSASKLTIKANAVHTHFVPLHIHVPYGADTVLPRGKQLLSGRCVMKGSHFSTTKQGNTKNDKNLHPIKKQNATYCTQSICWLIDWLIDWLTTNNMIHRLIDWLIDWLVLWLCRPLSVDWLIDWSIDY